MPVQAVSSFCCGYVNASRQFLLGGKPNDTFGCLVGKVLPIIWGELAQLNLSVLEVHISGLHIRLYVKRECGSFMGIAGKR